MKCRVRQDGDVHVVMVEGDLDVTTVGAFETEIMRLIDGGAMRIVIDCADLVFIDSASLGRLVAILKTFRPRGGILALSALRSSIRSTIEMIRLDRFMPLHAETDDAVASLR